MSCNSCSNITLPGVAGPAGPAGTNGTNGTDGDSIVVLKIYKRSAGMPANPAGGSYLFDTNTLTPPSGWSSGVPSGTDPCWVFHGTASVNGTTGTDSSINWSTPPVIAFENGADGADGVSVIEVNMTPTSTTSNSFASGATQTVPLNGTTLNFGDVDDFLRMKFSVIGDTTDNFFLGLIYDWQILYGSDTIIDTSISSLFQVGGYKDADSNGIEVEVDLIVTATDTITPIVRVLRSQAQRSTKFQISPLGGFDIVIVLPSVSISNPISGSNDLKLRVKNSDNSSTVDIIYFELVKYLK